MRFVLHLLTFLCSASLAQAQGSYENTCDPAIKGQCGTLSILYNGGLAPFPLDNDRANALSDLALDHARTHCGNGDGSTCKTLERSILFPGDAPSTKPLQTVFSSMQVLRALASLGCENGDHTACYFLAQNSAGPWRHLQYSKNTAEGLDTSNWVAKLFAETEAEADNWSEKTNQNARKAYEKAAPQSNENTPVVCGEMADLALYADDDRIDPFDVYSQACFGGAPQFCDGFRTLSFGWGRDEAAIENKAVKLLEDACTNALAEACATRAKLFPHKERERAVPFKKRACNLGHAKTCGLLGRKAFTAYLSSDDAADLSSASDLLEQGCAGGDTMSCHYFEHLSKG